MAEQFKKYSNITLRLSQESRYRLELLGRIQRRSQTGVLENLIKREADELLIKQTETDEKIPLFQTLWSPSEAERLVKLGFFRPDLQDFDESCVWTLIRREKKFWSETKVDLAGGEGPLAELLGRYSEPMTMIELEGNQATISKVRVEVVEACWDELKEAAGGNTTPLEAKLKALG